MRRWWWRMPAGRRWWRWLPMIIIPIIVAIIPFHHSLILLLLILLCAFFLRLELLFFLFEQLGGDPVLLGLRVDHERPQLLREPRGFLVTQETHQIQLRPPRVHVVLAFRQK